MTLRDAMGKSRRGERRPGKPSRDADGRPLCVWCGSVVKPPRRSWCSDECVEQYRIRTDPGFVRLKVEDRDHGICAHCGTDTERVRSDLATLARRCQKVGCSDEEMRAFRDAAEAAGIRSSGVWPFAIGHLWEAHHRIPVAEGGADCGLEGYETLCLACHRRATAELAKRLERRGSREKPSRKGDQMTPEEGPE